MLIIVICFFMEKKSLNLKPTIKMLTFQLCFVSEIFLMDLMHLEVSLNGNVHDFSVDYNSIGKSDIINIHKFSLVK